MPRLKQQTLFEFSSSSPHVLPKSSSPSKRKRAHEVASSSSSCSDEGADSDVRAIRFEPDTREVSDEDYSPRRPKERKSLVGAHAIPITTISDESLEEIVPRYRKGKDNIIPDSSEDDNRPRKRKLIKGTRPPTPDDDDDDDDDDVLEAKNLLDSRLRSRGKMTAFQRNLEKLKSRKRGEIVVESSPSENEQWQDSADVPFKGARPHHSGESDGASDSSQEEEDDFIVDDDALGVPAPQLPPAFSLSTHQDLTHHFKIVCQLFVHMAVQPMIDRRPFLERVLKEEEYLSVPLQVTRRKLCGMRDSLVASSVWRSSFKESLETHPRFTLVRLKFTIPQCDACHLGSRSSSLLGRLSGKPYDEYDFEDLSDDESDKISKEDQSGDEDEDSDTNRKPRNVKGEFYLGRFCAARTRVYHQFCHWEYSLYKSLQREIVEAQDGNRKFVKVAYAGGIKPPRDLHDGDRVMEWLDERGVIELEWQKIREMMDRARNLERGEVDE